MSSSSKPYTILRMKNFVTYIALCFVFVCCNEKNVKLSVVDTFVTALKEDRDEKVDTPNFTNEDISEFLAYRNDDQSISNFPRNPLSSFYLEEVSVGMYTLWNIESIRLKEIDSPDFYLFASLNPRIIKVSTSELVDQDAILSQIATAYLIWWTSPLPLAEKLQTNPLEGLDLSWN